MNRDFVRIGIDDPVLRDAELLVELSLPHLVAAAGGFGDDLDHEIGRAFHHAPEDRAAPPTDIDEVRLRNLIRRQYGVEGGDEHAPNRMDIEIGREHTIKRSDDVLMAQAGRRTHDQLTIDDLPQPVVFRHLQEVVVGNLR